MGKCASKITDLIQMPKANLSNGMKCSVVWEFVFISCMELWCVARLLVCPLRPRCFDTSLTEWNPFLLALTGFKTLPVHLHKSQFLKNLKAHSFLIVQLISLPFWLILNSLNCLCKDERLGFFFFTQGLWHCSYYYSEYDNLSFSSFGSQSSHL